MLAQIYGYQPGEARFEISNGPTQNYAVFALPPDDTWARYEIVIDVPTGTATLSIDGVVVATAQVASAIQRADRADFALGLSRGVGGLGLTAIYDDIVFEPR